MFLRICFHSVFTTAVASERGSRQTPGHLGTLLSIYANRAWKLYEFWCENTCFWKFRCLVGCFWAKWSAEKCLSRILMTDNLDCYLFPSNCVVAHERRANFVHLM
jgi:hypothetical protein